MKKILKLKNDFIAEPAQNKIKKEYTTPRIISVETLEIVANICIGGTSKTVGGCPGPYLS